MMTSLIKSAFVPSPMVPFTLLRLTKDFVSVSTRSAGGM